ncbi:MAG: hypothetical protein FJX29_07685 [Alphaproteobacteria bacterium]|nr:hypothetical protein [Alphaproteobacteria bacterium]
MQKLPQILQSFISDLRAIWSRGAEAGANMRAAQPLLEKLLLDEGLQKLSSDWPSTEGRKNLLFYTDPDYGFAINAVVRVPGRTGNIHDHGPVWVLYGVLTGTESLERYERLDDGARKDFARIRLTGVGAGAPGKSDLVPPHDIHRELGGPTRSVAIILRGAQLGEIIQGRYNLETGEVAYGSGPEQIPYSISAAA